MEKIEKLSGDWMDEINRLQLELPSYNDVVSGKDAPHPNFGKPYYKDVNLLGYTCDIYHCDGNPANQGVSSNRLYLHIKK